MSHHSQTLLNNCRRWHPSSPHTTTGRRTGAGDAVAFDGHCACKSESEWCLSLCCPLMIWQLVPDLPCLCPLIAGLDSSRPHHPGHGNKRIQKRRMNEIKNVSVYASANKDNDKVSTIPLTGRREGRQDQLPTASVAATQLKKALTHEHQTGDTPHARAQHGTVTP